MKILVLGGGGFIGSHVLYHLSGQGHQVTGFGRQTPNVLPTSVGWISGEFVSGEGLPSALEGVDVVCHLISATHPRSSNDSPIFDIANNLSPTVRLLDLMVQKGVPRIVFLSSGGTVYGNPRYLPIDEEHPTNPKVSYGIVKLAIEKYLGMYDKAHGLKSIALRVANPYGERQPTSTGMGAVGVFLGKAFKNEPIELWGDGSVVRDYLHVEDVAQAVALAATYDGDQSVFNIGSGMGTSLNELIQYIERVLETTLDVRRVAGRNFDVPANVLDCGLARAELGWQTNVGLGDGIERTAKWFGTSANSQA